MRYLRIPDSIAGKLYLIAVFAIVAVCCLAAASLFFANKTLTAADHLTTDAFVGMIKSTELELLLEQHRRIVQSMPAEVDRARLSRSRSQLDIIAGKLKELIATLIKEDSGARLNDLERLIASEFPQLFKLGDRVAFYAYNFAQDKAFESSEQYALVARSADQHIRQYREGRLVSARVSVSELRATASALLVWTLTCAVITLLLIGPVGLRSMHRVLSRLAGVTEAILRIARDDHAVKVPSLLDKDEIGQIARAVQVFSNNAVQLAAREMQLAETNRRFDIALNNMTHGLCMFDPDQRLIVSNAVYREMYQLPPALTRPGTEAKTIEAYCAGAAATAGEKQEAVRELRAHGLPIDGASSVTRQLSDGRVIAIAQQRTAEGGWVAVHEDISQRCRAEAEIAYLAHHDTLTELPNRAAFRQHLDRAFSSGSSFAVLCLDLDRFKQVNDSFGHPLGDELLKAVARRLVAAVKKHDIVARMGGDEFAIVQSSVSQLEHSGRLAQRIIDVISQPYAIDGKQMVVGASIGIAHVPLHASDADELLRNADLALYLAKSQGRGTHRFFEPELGAQVQDRQALELDLRRALTNGELELYYQPIVKLDELKITGFEALLRWNHPQRGQLAPLEFIGLAEETGLILPIGEWVLRTACAHAARWPANINIAVNLSPRQFQGYDLLQLTVNALAAAGLPPTRLELEITESLFLGADPSTIATLHQLRAIGVRIAMDDFGTGYSSLAYLRSFPFDKIKIDRSFVRDMPERDDCKAIVHAIVGLAHSLNIQTVVEGVEIEAQLELARVEGCNEGQGYLFGQPAPEAEVTNRLLKTPRLVYAA